MNDRKPQTPNLSSRGRPTRESRQERLAEALRENLRRRKAQARDRGKAAERPAGEGEPGGEA